MANETIYCKDLGDYCTCGCTVDPTGYVLEGGPSALVCHCCNNIYIEEEDPEIAELKAAQRWIDAGEDKKPEEEKSFAYIHPGYGIQVGMYSNNPTNSNNLPSWERYKESIIKWLPLPPTEE